MTDKELHDLLDIELTKTIEEIRIKAIAAGMDRQYFEAQVTGFLMKTSIYIGMMGGCPQDVMKFAASAAIDDVFSSKPVVGQG